MVPACSHEIPRASWYSGFTRDVRVFVYRVLTFCDWPSHAIQLTFPSADECPNPGYFRFGLFPVRSPLLGESSFLSFPPGTQMFQFPGLPPHWLCVHQWVIGHYSNGVFLFGDPCVFVCLRLNTAFRSLPRPSSALSAKASTACPYLLNLLLSCAYSSFLEVITICSEKFFCVYVRKTHRLSFFHF